ncbi:GH15 family glucan-1,4-alpha-glucosidase [Actinomadura luteofluorescens]|uniref:GH15 family glucan-1,4-alpha-glucosidase n=1 Tax=Actinomadura luteofluorescens TaxID=46163 RepID=A0A7Y9JGS6_9ACTN|nr:glycoside hydrolase family 15 protein [Actinomadura luteofluorescens]NYD48577.1 GH15 family glucan-1,4-alpha-glucosidase [Actinomadura luteofluorescens]
MRSALTIKELRKRWRVSDDAALAAAALGANGIVGPKYTSPDIGATAVLGNAHGRIAVVRTDRTERYGDIVSWNVPFGHGVPVCNGLYDGPEDTTFWLGLDGVSRPGEPVFKPNSNTLVSRWRSRTGRAEERTVMVGSPTGSDGNQLLRQLTCKGGRVTAAFRIRLRYGHMGEKSVVWTLNRHGGGYWEYTAMAGNTKLFLTTNVEPSLSEGGGVLTGTMALKTGESAFVSVGGHDCLSPRNVEEANRLFDETEDGWHKWVQTLRFRSGKYAEVGVRAAINLRILGYGDGGSFYAAATRSLPEDDPRHGLAVRCWDYLKDWERDAVLTILSLTDAGDQKVLRARYQWYKKLHDIRHRLSIMHEVDGGNVASLGEVVIPGVGYRGSIYRVGNGAGDQEQHDWTSYAAEVHYLMALQGEIDLERTAALAEQTMAALFKPCSGVWEIRPAENQENQENGAKLRIYASVQILAGQALIRFAEIFEIAGMMDRARECRARAAEVMPWVRKNCVKHGVIVAAPDMPVLDSSILLAFMQAPDMFESTDEKLVRATALAIDTPHTARRPIKGLRVGKGHRRYNADQFSDGISTEEEGNFTNITGWLAIVFLQLGMIRRAESRMGELLASFNRVEQSSEEQWPDGLALGNLNQAYVYQAVIWFVLLYQAIMADQEEARTAEAVLV